MPIITTNQSTTTTIVIGARARTQEKHGGEEWSYKQHYIFDHAVLNLKPYVLARQSSISNLDDLQYLPAPCIGTPSSENGMPPKRDFTS